MHLYRKLVSTKVDGSTDKDLESGVDQLLRQLKQVISQMQAWVSSGGSEIFSHTLTRHQEILQDLTQVIACYGRRNMALVISNNVIFIDKNSYFLAYIHNMCICACAFMAKYESNHSWRHQLAKFQ